MAVSTAGKADVPPLTTGAIAAGDALWARFMTPGSSAEFLSSWFSLLSHEIAGLTGSVLLLERQDGGFARAASWAPDAAELAEADLEAKVKAGLKMPDFIQSRIDAGLFNEID